LGIDIITARHTKRPPSIASRGRTGFGRRSSLLYLLFLILCTASAQGRSFTIEYEHFTVDREHNAYVYSQPRVTWDDIVVTGAELTYDREGGSLDFIGNVVIRPPGLVLTAFSAVFDLKTTRATLHQATLYDEANQVFVSANRIDRIDDEQYIIYQGSLTRCDPEEKAWEIRGGRIVYRVDNFAYALNTSMHFYTLPVFYSPFFSWPTRRGRASGFLTPDFETTESSNRAKSYGGRLKVPYFAAIDRDHDLTVTADIIQRRGLGIGLDYLYAFRPGMTGQLQTWYLDEVVEDRNLDDPNEHLGLLNPDLDGLDPRPVRYKYHYQHRQHVFWNGQLFLHQRLNSDNELDKEYFAKEVGLDDHYQRSISLVFPWSGGSLSLDWETGETFLYPSVFDRSTDRDTHLNRHPAVTIGHGFSRIAGTPLSAGFSGNVTRYERAFGWNALFQAGTVQLAAPFFIDFLNVLPTVQRDYHRYQVTYSPKPGIGDQPSGAFGWSIDSRSLEFNFEVFRLFYNHVNIAHRKLSFRPRLIYDEVEDVDQHQQTLYGFGSPVMSRRTVSYRLETRYLVKNLTSGAVRSIFGLDLTQPYNLQMERDEPVINQPDLLETQPGNSQLPLRIALSVSPISAFSAGLFYRYGHEQGRVVETRADLTTTSASGDRFTLSFINNPVAYRTPDNTLNPAAQFYTVSHLLRVSDHLDLGLYGKWDWRRDIHTENQLNRQLTAFSVSMLFRHQCYQFSATYAEEIGSEVIGGVNREYLDQRLTFRVELPVSVGAGTLAQPGTGIPYEQLYVLPRQ
jgi:hypothetical protein